MGNDLTDVVAHMKHLHFDVLRVYPRRRVNGHTHGRLTVDG